MFVECLCTPDHVVVLIPFCFVLDVKPNELGSTQFKAVVALGGLCDAECPRYPVMGVQYPMLERHIFSICDLMRGYDSLLPKFGRVVLILLS